MAAQLFDDDVHLQQPVGNESLVKNNEKKSSTSPV